MSENARILLSIIREANKRHVDLSPDVQGVLKTALGITENEIFEIGEILKADIREMNATYPRYGEINEQLNQMG